MLDPTSSNMPKMFSRDRWRISKERETSIPRTCMAYRTLVVDWAERG